MKRIIKDYFTFSKKERIAVVLLALLVMGFITAPYLYNTLPDAPVDTPALDAFIANTSKRNIADSAHGKEAVAMRATTVHAETMPRKPENFPFDPNTITEEEWQRLGVSEKAARTIIHYRNKGGRFRTPGDIKKIWGIRQQDAERLLPWVRLPAKGQEEYASGKERAGGSPVSSKKTEAIDINTATSEEWKSLPGIGEVFAKRILSFREHIGGFTSAAQVAQTYGLADSAFRKIERYLKLNVQTMPKWNINALSAYDLQRRLFLDAATAKAIVYFRKKNGALQSLEALRTCGVPDTMLQRITVFLTTE